MTELDIWATFGANQSAAGSHFIAIAFLVWVGLRVSNNIRNSDEANIVMKLAGTGFCLSVAYFSAFNMGWYEWNANGTAAALSSLESISLGAQTFVTGMNPGADFNLRPSFIQGIFLASILVMQMGQIWMPKK